MNKKYLILLALIIGVGSLQAQSLKRFKLKATEAYDAKNFSRALEYYQIIINDAEDETPENYYKAAESAREFRIYGLAEKYYRQILSDTAAVKRYRLTNYHLGTVLKSQGQYEAAIPHFDEFLNKHASFVSEKYTAKAQKEKDDCKWAFEELTDDGTPVTHLDTTINTPNSELSPILIGNKLYFSSVRYSTNADNLPETPLTRIYVSEDGKLANQVSDDFNEELMHSSHATFNADASKVYYTLCSSVNATEVRCKIYYREKNDDKWGGKVALSDKINRDSFTATHPNIGYDKTTGKEVLYFVSDRLVDENDKDKDLNIWFSIKDGDYFGEAVYMSDINTDEDDVTPFFDSKSQTLYFSSKGHQNMGGFDIYSTKKGAYGWEKPRHMGAPVNSSYDDVYYTLSPENRTSYISSNRLGAICDDNDNELCSACNDIYRIPQLKVDIKVLTFNALTKRPLKGVTVSFEDLTSQNKEDPKSDPNGNEYDYTGNFDFKYSTTGDLTGYIQDDSLFNTIDIPSGITVEIPLYLTPKVDLVASTFSQATFQPLNGVKVELFKIVEKSDLFSEDTLIGSQVDRTRANYDYDLNYGVKYMVVGSKFGYSTDTSFATTTVGIDTVPTHLFDSLYLCKSPPALTKLYFYNDEPNRRSRSRSTYWTYQKAFNNLMSDTIQQQFTQELASEPLEDRASQQFFEEVIIGKTMLDSFINLLMNDPSYLSNNNVKVIVRGFASPRAKNDYNMKLTSRRIKSVENYFEEKGLLEKYPNQIFFDHDPNGEEKAPPGIVDVIADRKKSIYYAAPSRERRVEIVWVLDAPDACPKEEITQPDYEPPYDTGEKPKY